MKIYSYRVDKRTPAKERNYFLYRDRQGEEVPWIRIKDFHNLSLPRPIVVVNGAFDILHSGHMKVIFAAKDKARTLIAAVDSDERIRSSKGPHRPVMSIIERMNSLNYMPVDYLVEIETGRDMYNLLRIVNPDLRVQGEDYVGEAGKYPWVQKMFVRDGGIRTSEIERRIRERSK